MLEQKQIEEMSEDIARVLCEIYRPNCDEYQPHSCSKCYVNSTQIGDFVEMLYEAGYRKQSEWISVEERLPTWEDGKVLIYTPYGISIAQKTTTNHWKGDNAIPKLITHWMPLPEAPKGGEE